MIFLYWAVLDPDYIYADVVLTGKNWNQIVFMSVEKVMWLSIVWFLHTTHDGQQDMEFYVSFQEMCFIL